MLHFLNRADGIFLEEISKVSTSVKVTFGFMKENPEITAKLYVGSRRHDLYALVEQVDF